MDIGKEIRTIVIEPIEKTEPIKIKKKPIKNPDKVPVPA